MKKCHQKKEDQKNGWEKKDTYKKEKMDGLDKLKFIFPGIYIYMYEVVPTSSEYIIILFISIAMSLWPRTMGWGKF